MSEQAPRRKRILSGIQPTGTFTLGNYIGAVRNWAKLQDQFDCLYMVADLHALTVRQEPAALRRHTREAAAMLLAAGIDPMEDLKAKIFAAVDPEAPSTLKDGGVIAAGYNSEVDELRSIRENTKGVLAQLEARLREFAAQGWAEETDGRWRLTPRGFLVSNQLIGDLLDRQEQASWEDLIRPRQDQA